MNGFTWHFLQIILLVKLIFFLLRPRPCAINKIFLIHQTFICTAKKKSLKIHWIFHPNYKKKNRKRNKILNKWHWLSLSVIKKRQPLPSTQISQKTHKDKEKTPFKNHNSIIHECIIQSKSIFLYFKNKILFKYLNGKTDKTKL